MIINFFLQGISLIYATANLNDTININFGNSRNFKTYSLSCKLFSESEYLKTPINNFNSGILKRNEDLNNSTDILNLNFIEEDFEAILDIYESTPNTVKKFDLVKILQIIDLYDLLLVNDKATDLFYQGLANITQNDSSFRTQVIGIQRLVENKTYMLQLLRNSLKNDKVYAKLFEQKVTIVNEIYMCGFAGSEKVSGDFNMLKIFSGGLENIKSNDGAETLVLFMKTQNISKLDVSECKMSDHIELFQLIGKMKTLKSLNLRSTNVSMLLQYLENPNLEDLNISFNNLKDDDLKAVGNLKTLKTIKISYCNTTNFLQYLHPLNLSNIYCDGNCISQEDCEIIKKTDPKKTIYHYN